MDGKDATAMYNYAAQVILEIIKVPLLFLFAAHNCE